MISKIVIYDIMIVISEYDFMESLHHITKLFHVMISSFDLNACCMMSWYDVIIWCQRLCIGCHAMKSIHETIYIWIAFARTRWPAAVFGGSSLFQIRGWAPYWPLLPRILRLLLVLRPHRAVPRLGSVDSIGCLQHRLRSCSAKLGCCPTPAKTPCWGSVAWVLGR